jgi:hypothetical protein
LPFDSTLKQSRQERLHDAVRRLNGRQRAARIYFYRDGKGGVGWSLIPYV